MQINITNGTVSAVTQTLTATSGHSLPAEIMASGATASYNSSTGVLTLTNLGETVYIDIPTISSFTSVEISSDTDYIYLTIDGTTYQLDKGTAAPITFTVGGFSYSADYGMTWTQFVASAYNDGSFSIAGTNVCHQPYYYVGDAEGNLVYASDTIIANYAYCNQTSG